MLRNCAASPALKGEAIESEVDEFARFAVRNRGAQANREFGVGVTRDDDALRRICHGFTSNLSHCPIEGGIKLVPRLD
jgi:hypothetical protein